METVFIAGSITIKTLDARVKERVDKILSGGMKVIVGDADGIDSAIQNYLFNANASGVNVFCSGETPRNNIGDWDVVRVQTTHAAGSRAFFTAKDLRMAEVADYGLMIWDSKSTGTLSNVIELLSRGKKSVVFVQKDKTFKNVANVDQLEVLVSQMTESARKKADEKIKLEKRIELLRNQQGQMFA